MVLSFFQSLGLWSWFVLGVLLLALEIMVPGTFIIWLGFAAIATGLVTLALGLGWQAQFIVFAVFSVISVVIWLTVVRKRGGAATDQPMLGRRAERHVGRQFTLDVPIVEGNGRVRIDDTVWRITGPDCPAGTRVRVTRTEGATLVVDIAP